MYRRKRKRLQSQQEINPGVVLDEPGWIYFNRLKFLDDATTTSNADFGLYVPFLTVWVLFRCPYSVLFPP